MTDHDPSEARDFLARLATGDREAADELYRDLAGGVRRYCRHLLGDPASAEDAAQNTFLAVLGKAGQVRDGASLRSWVFRIARNECLLAARKRSHALPLDEEPGTPDDDTPLALVISGELRDAVRDAVRILPPIYREAIVLREFEGLSYREIADAIGMPVSTVKFRLFKARERLVELLQGVLDDRRV